jgi:hypothetical protein
MHGKSTQFSFATLTPTSIGEVGTFISADFLGGNYYGTGTTISKNSYETSNGYTPRLREGYIKIDNDNYQILAGQTWSTFADMEALGKSVETYNLSAICETLQPQVRVTKYLMDKKLSLAFAVESSSSDYTDTTGRRYDDGTSVTDGNAFQSLPDVTMQVKYKEDDKFQVALRGVVRNLEVNLPVTSTTVETTPGYRWKTRALGYGVGLSSKLFYENIFFNKKTKSYVYGQIIFGQGIGRYIYEALGQSAAYSSSYRRLSTQMGTGYIVGIEKFWTDQWSTNVGYGQVRIHFPGWFAAKDATYPVTTKIEQFLINLIYSPIKNLEIGIEYNKYRRFAQGASYYTGTGTTLAAVAGYPSKEYSGTAHRVQMMVKYIF